MNPVDIHMEYIYNKVSFYSGNAAVFFCDILHIDKFRFIDYNKKVNMIGVIKWSLRINR